MIIIETVLLIILNLFILGRLLLSLHSELKADQSTTIAAAAQPLKANMQKREAPDPVDIGNDNSWLTKESRI